MHIPISQVSIALLAGGLATRLRPITTTIPKAMVEVAGRPFIDHQLKLLYRNGIRRVVLCLGYLGEQVAEHVGDGAAYGMQITYSFDGDRLLGTGGALRRAADQFGDIFWVLYGDSYLDIDYPTILDQFQQQHVLALMTVLRNGNQWDRSNVVFRDGQLLCYDKHTQTAEMEYIDYGATLMRHEVFESIPVNTAYDLADLYAALVREGHMIGYEVTQRFYEIGSHAGLEETRRYLRDR